MGNVVYTTLAITQKTLGEAHSQGFKYVHCPTDAGEYHEIMVERNNKEFVATNIDPVACGIPLRPFDARESFIRRPKGINTLPVEEERVIMTKFYKNIHMEPPVGFVPSKEI